MENQIKLEYLINFLNDKKINKIQKSKEGFEKKILDYLEYYNSSKFSKFNDILSNNVDRIGIRQNNLIKNSFYFSFLLMTFNNFNIMEEKDQNFIISTLKNKIKDDLISKNFKSTFRLKKLKQMLEKDLNTYDDVYLLCQYFDINIFIFNNKTNKVISFYNDNKINIYKSNIFLSYINETFFPLVYKMNNGNYFKYNSTILNKLIFSEYIEPYNKDEFIITNCWSEILDKYKNVDTSNIIVDLNIETLNDSDTESEKSLDLNNLNIKLEEYTNESYDSDISLDDIENINIELENTSCNYDVENLEKYKKNELLKIYDDLKLNKKKLNSKSLKKDIINDIQSQLS